MTLVFILILIPQAASVKPFPTPQKSEIQIIQAYGTTMRFHQWYFWAEIITPDEQGRALCGNAYRTWGTESSSTL